jgi:aspartate aminotransferase
MIARRAQAVTPSPTLALNAQAKRLQAEGMDIVNLTAGEPDFATPAFIAEAAVAALQEGASAGKYAPAAGLPELRDAIAEKFRRENGIVGATADSVIVGVGAKHILLLAFEALLNPGDEVVIPTPAWGTYEEQVKLCGGVPVRAEMPPPFVPTAELIERVLTDRTKVIVLNSPSNPTGATIDEAELRKIAALAVERDLMVVTDEIYEALVYDGRTPVSIASFGPEIAERTVTVNGFSKAYAMTGWRVGYATGPQEVIAAMSALSSQSTSGTATISQLAALAALQGEPGKIETAAMAAEFLRRRDLLCSRLAEVDGIAFERPHGAFYLFAAVSAVLGKGETSAAWAARLLETSGVAVVPGEAFAAPGYIRVSFAASLEQLESGAERIKEFIEKHSR